MEAEIGTKTRNSVWKCLSRNINRSKIGAFARALTRAFGSIRICKRGVEESFEVRVPSSEPSDFVYPDDRYLSNDEILQQLEVLEKRFNKQADIFARAQGKEVHFRKAKPYHGNISPDLKRDPLSFLVATIRPPRYTEERFAALEDLVRKVKQRRQGLDSSVTNQAKYAVTGRTS
ncbi:uncharacterized protein LOC123537580 [Mercenaria mercenaria]|uniref:uncharacterized protein LOC123537580 n=1 Tax=Mercenaria mercenaria TaxID=6596 RepID=UPI00234F541C|nr:uncharacterized protein LOC123537580 [Mercenaria mercenaria]